MHLSKRFKRIAVCGLASVLLFQSIGAVAASNYYYTGSKANHKRRYYAGSYKVYFNGRRVNSSSTPGVYINDNFMVPYKACLVSKGPKMTSSFKKSKRRLSLKYNGNNIIFYLGKKYVKLNGKKYTLNTAPTYVRIRGKKKVVVPAKALSRLMGWSYTASRASKKICMSSSDAAPTPIVPANVNTSNLQATAFKSMTISQFIATVGPIAQANYHATGIKASVTLAQAINESGWGKSSLTQQSNNMFGMKKVISGNTWAGSTWTGAYINVVTREEVKGKLVKVVAPFRKYDNVPQSIADHSAYLSNAMNGSRKRYYGINDAQKTYYQQLVLLQQGGYCTWSGYVSELSALIKRYNLTTYDQ